MLDQTNCLESYIWVTLLVSAWLRVVNRPLCWWAARREKQTKSGRTTQTTNVFSSSMGWVCPKRSRANKVAGVGLFLGEGISCFTALSLAWLSGPWAYRSETLLSLDIIKENDGPFTFQTFRAKGPDFSSVLQLQPRSPSGNQYCDISRLV